VLKSGWQPVGFHFALFCMLATIHAQMLWQSMLQHSTPQHSMAWHGTEQHITEQHCAAQCAQRSTAQLVGSGAHEQHSHCCTSIRSCVNGRSLLA